MKKRYLLMGLLASSLVVGLTSCTNGDKVESNPPTADSGSESESESKDPVVLSSIELSGQPTLFKVGSNFNSTGLTVTAKMSDGTTEDVTSKATLTQEANMNTVGDYKVTVAYGGKSAEYTIKVLNPTGLTLDTTNAKVDYLRRDTFTTEGLKASLSYPTGLEADDVALTDLTTEIKIGDAVDNELNTLGKHTVSVAYGDYLATYEINVKVETISEDASLEEILELAQKYGYLVTGGVYSDNPEKPYNYSKGDGFLAVQSENKVDNVVSNTYYTKYQDKDIAYVINSKKDSDEVISIKRAEGNMNGVADVNILGNDAPVYGPEDALQKMLEEYLAVERPADSFVKNGTANANGLHESYTFKFAVENFDDQLRKEVRDITATVTLADELYVEKLDVQVKWYKEMEKDAEGNYPDLSTVTPSDLHVEYTQDNGARDVKMPYSISDLAIASYKLKVDGKEITAKDTVEIGLYSEVKFDMTDILGEKASITFDEPTFWTVPESIDSPALNDSSCTFDSNSNSFKVYGDKLGERTIEIKTLNTSFKLNINVTAPVPTEITPYVVAEIKNNFADMKALDTEYYCDLNKELVLFGQTSAGSDPRYKIEVVSAPEGVDKNTLLNSSLAEFEGNENTIYTLTPSVKGDYVLKFISEKDNNITYTLTLKAGVEKTAQQIAEAFVGTWESQVASYVIGNSDVTVEGVTEIIYKYVENEYFLTDSYKFVINEDGTLTLIQDASEFPLTKVIIRDATNSLPLTLVGDFVCADNEDKITTTETTIKFGNGEALNITKVQQDKFDFTVTYTENGKDKTIVISYTNSSYYPDSITIPALDENGNPIKDEYGLPVNYIYDYQGTGAPQVDIAEEYVGNYETDSSFAIVAITTNTITYDDWELPIIEYTEGVSFKTKLWEVQINEDGTLTFVTFESSEGLTVAGDSGNTDPDTGETAEIPEGYQGTYVAADGSEIIVGATTLTINGKEYTITSAIMNWDMDGYEFTIDYGEDNYTDGFEVKDNYDGTFKLTDFTSGVTYNTTSGESGESGETITLPEGFLGEYKNADSVVTITATTVTLGTEENNILKIEYDVVSEMYWITLANLNDYQLVENSDGTYSFIDINNSNLTYLKGEADPNAGGEETNTGLPESYLGLYINNANPMDTIMVNADHIMIGTDRYNNSYMGEIEAGCWYLEYVGGYSFTIETVAGKLQFTIYAVSETETDQTYVKEGETGGNGETETLTAIPEEFTGEYKNANPVKPGIKFTATSVVIEGVDHPFTEITAMEGGYFVAYGTKATEQFELIETEIAYECTTLGKMYSKDKDLPAVTIPATYKGIYDSQMYSVIVRDNEVTINVMDIENIYKYVEGEYFKTKSFTFNIAADGSLTMVDNFTNDETPLEKTSVAEVPANLVGTYTTEGTTNSIVVTATTIKILDAEPVEFEFVVVTEDCCSLYLTTGEMIDITISTDPCNYISYDGFWYDFVA